MINQGLRALVRGCGYDDVYHLSTIKYLSTPYLSAGLVIPEIHKSIRCELFLFGVDEVGGESVAVDHVMRTAAPLEPALGIPPPHVGVAATATQLALGAASGDAVHHAGG